jgi:hypothetical protein
VSSYTSTNAASYGTELDTVTTSQYENLVSTGSSPSNYDVLLAQTTVSESGTNVTAADADAGGAPYAFTENQNTAYVSPTTLGVYPLAAGTQWTTSLARTVTTTTSTTSASGTPYSKTNLTTVYKGDDSYTESGQTGLTTTTSRAAYPNGTGSETDSNGTTTTLQRKIGTPTHPAHSLLYQIPVSEIGSGGTTSNFNATDWYPGAALPSSPLGSTTYKVTGPATTLPDGCTYSGDMQGVVEYQSTTSSLDVVGGSITQGTSDIFDLNGLAVCRSSTTTVNYYTVTTGALERTVVTKTQYSLQQ